MNRFGHHRFAARKIFFALFVLIFAALFLSCAAGDGDDDNDDDGGSDNGGDGGGDGGGATSNFFTLERTADERGFADASFDIPLGTTKFSVTAQSIDSSSVRFEEVTDEDGNDFLSPSGEMISFSNEFFPGSNAVSVPSRDVDPDVDASQTFRVRARIVTGSGNAEGTPVNFTVAARSDGSLGSGTLLVNIFYVGDVGQSALSKNAMGVALDEFRRIYATSAGIVLRVVERDIAGPTVLPNPFDGSDFYRSAALLGEFPAVNIFVCGDVEGSEGDVLGLAGGIPGTPIPSIRSGVVVSILTGAGPDGDFDNVDVRLLGESMAHESGHYLGLFHPVDFSGSLVSSTDPLSDTPTCTRSVDCDSNPSLITNLMYVAPVLVGGEFVPQDQLSTQQRGVLNRYIAVD